MSEPQPAVPRFPLLGITLIGFGLVIGVMSYPVSQSSHAIAEEMKKRNPGKEGVRKGMQGAMKAGEKGVNVFARPPENDNDFLALLRIIVALLACVWCCCVCILGAITEVAIEPIGEALGIAAQFSVITMAVFFGLFGISHILAGIGLINGRSWARWLVQPLLLFDGCQGLVFLGAGPALWRDNEPTFGIIAMSLGMVLATICFPASWFVARRA